MTMSIMIYKWKYESEENMYSQSINDILEHIYQETVLKLEQCITKNITIRTVYKFPGYNYLRSSMYTETEFMEKKTSTVYTPIREWYKIHVCNLVKAEYDRLYLKKKKVSLYALYINQE